MGLAALMLSIGSAAYTQDTLTLSVGTGAYGKYMWTHQTIIGQGDPLLDLFDDIQTNKTMSVGSPITIRAELFRYLGVDTSAYYLRNKFYPGKSANNRIRGVFSVYGQIPIEITNSITILPLLGVGYDMLFYSWSKTGSSTRKNLKNLNDDLLLKPGVGLKVSLTDFLRLDARLIYDVMLFNKSVSDTAKNYKSNGNRYFVLQHAPSLFVGVGYEFLKI